MAIYSIKDVENISGIKAHTLRIWEKRYAILEPRRTKTNIRYYIDEDLKKIMDIALLRKQGLKISKIAKLTESEFQEKIISFTGASAECDDRIESLIIATMDLDDFKIHSILDKNIKSIGLEEVMNELIFPYLDRIIMMWMAGTMSSIHERFVMGIIRRKLLKGIDDSVVKKYESDLNIILYLPQEEQNEISLLYLQYLLVKDGHRVINLGTNTDLLELEESLEYFDAKMVFTMFNESYLHASLKPYISELQKITGDIPVYLTGYAVMNQKFDFPKKIAKVSNIHEVRSLALEMNKK